MSTHVCEITRPFGGYGVRRVIMLDGSAVVMTVDADTDDAARRLADWWRDAV